MDEKYRIMQTRKALRQLVLAFREVEENLAYVDFPEEALDIFSEGYPFDKSFEEVCEEVNNWVFDINIELSKLQRDI